MDAETRYLQSAYGLYADTPQHKIEKGGVVMTCLTKELPAMLAEGWRVL